MAGMDRSMPVQWIPFALAVPISLYVTFFGTVAMGFCPGIQCWPHTFAWTLLAPSLLLAILSLRAAAAAATILLVVHVYTEVHIYGGGLNTNTLWGTDLALDKCFWIAVFLLLISAFPSKKHSTPN